jgi:phage tail sheath gpL-like
MDKEFLIGMGISLVLTALRGGVTNPELKAQIKSAILKVYKAIKVTYADDPDFAE